MKEETIIHPIPPLYREDSKILILGSFPSVKSRESAFFYGHPQNRFWKVMAAVFEDDVPSDVPQKRAFLIRHQVAAWDVIHSCTIRGSSDASIKDVVPNDLTIILDHAPIRRIFVNGKTADRLCACRRQALPMRPGTWRSSRKRGKYAFLEMIKIVIGAVLMNKGIWIKDLTA